MTPPPQAWDCLSTISSLPWMGAKKREAIDTQVYKEAPHQPNPSSLPVTSSLIYMQAQKLHRKKRGKRAWQTRVKMNSALSHMHSRSLYLVVTACCILCLLHFAPSGY